MNCNYKVDRCNTDDHHIIYRRREVDGEFSYELWNSKMGQKWEESMDAFGVMGGFESDGRHATENEIAEILAKYGQTLEGDS